MDVYHKILGRLYELTGGKQNESVDLKELVKEAGFLPSYEDIFRQMSRAGWISESGRGNKVKITHWGVKEAKKGGTGGTDGARELKKLARKLQEEAKELLVMCEELSSETVEGNLKQVEKQLDTVSELAKELKASI